MMASTPQLPMWRPKIGKMPIKVFLSDETLGASELHAFKSSGFDASITSLPLSVPLPDEGLQSTAAVILEVQHDDRASIERLEYLVRKYPDVVVIGAMAEISVPAVRMLMRLGAADVLALPLAAEDIEQTLDRLQHDLAEGAAAKRPNGKVVSIIGSAGGIGTTSLLTQLASLFATTESERGRTACLLDLDIQFGNASLYLGGLPSLSIKDVLEAGARADGALLRSTAALHPTGLHYVAAPPEIMPLESINPDLALAVLDLSAGEFDTVFVDLPNNWTNWSLSALARSDLILLVVELSVSSLHQARRQLEMIKNQGITEAPVHVIVNRLEKKLFRPIDLSDVRRTLGKDVSFTVAEDDQAFTIALDQGVTLASASPRSRVTKDLRKMASGLADTLTKANQHVAG